ncbi:hypothetical protein [Granulicoccus phenolivorans]|uniref:hypothetical protein n=1 Tax=Granulicoccus phenolivorans TaxID=266854 RepID=UPI000429405F|nr:hypothetical protein [Granulicoccus phenolivorans]
MAEQLDFLNGVSKLHAMYTEQVRMLAHAHGMSNEQAAILLDQFGYYNVARQILVEPRHDVTRDGLAEIVRDETVHNPKAHDEGTA